ncbi:MAG: MATE family efflux transporter [Sulfurospirillum sp.]|nr:MAG: MATE family efflux transporter [Sulfurospirillum sp.]
MSAHRRVLHLATPLVFNLLFNVLIVYTDFFMVAKLGEEAIAAVGMGTQIWGICFAISSLFYTGQSALLTRFVGAKEQKRASLTLSSTLLFASAIGLPLILSWNYLGQHIFIWFGAPEGVLSEGQAYIGTLAYVAPLIMINAVFDSAFSAYGNVRTALYINGAVVVLNALLDYLLIFGHGGFEAMGVRGAAIATVVAEIFSFTVFTLLYLRGKTFYTPMVRFSKKLLVRVLRVGLPSMAERLLSSTSYLIFTGMVLVLGTEIYAGFQIGFRIEGLAFMPGIAFAVTASILMGQGLGEKNPDKSHADVMLSLKYALAIMFSVSLAFMLIPEKLGSIFTQDAGILHYASIYLVIVGVSQVPLGIQFVLYKALNGAGATRETFWINTASMWLIRIIPSTISVYLFHSVTGVYLAMIADTFVKAVLFWRLFHEGNWRALKV